MPTKVKRTLLVTNKDDAKTYLNADGVSLGITSFGNYILARLYMNSGKNGYAILNDTSKVILYPNDKAHPVEADVNFFTSVLTNNKSCFVGLLFDDVQVASEVPSSNGTRTDVKSLKDEAILQSSKNSVIRFHLHANNTVNAVTLQEINLSLYFMQYACAAKSVSSTVTATVDKTEAYDGDIVTFTATVADGEIFEGWYSDISCTNLVSTDQKYSVSPTSDLILYAKDTQTVELFTCAAVAGAKISSVNVSDSTIPANGSCTFSATVNTGCTFDGWYSDESCTNLVSTENPYTATITADTTLYAKAHRKNLSISVGSAEHGTATVSATTVPWGSDVTFTFTPEDETWELYGWYSDLTLTQLVSEANPYTFTVTENVTLYPKVGRKMLTITLTTLSPFDGSVHTLLSCDLNSLTSDELIALKRGNLEAISQNKIFDKQTVTSANSIVPKTISIKCPMGYAIGMSASGSNDTVTIFFTSEDVTLTFWPYYMTIPTGNQKYRTVKYNGTCLCSSQGLDGISSTYVPSHVVQGSAAPFEAEVKPGYVFQGWYDNTGALINSNNPANITTPVDNSGASPLKATSLTLYAKAISAIASATGIFLKCNGSWLESKKVYKKVSGTWVEQTNVASLFDGTASGSPTNYVCGGRV